MGNTRARTERLLTVVEVAAGLGVSRWTVQRRIAKGRIAWVNVADDGDRPRVRVKQSALDAYIARQMQGRPA